MKKFLITFLTLFLVLPITRADNFYFEIKQEHTVSQIQTELQVLIDATGGNDTVFVTGSKTNVEFGLELCVIGDRTIVWQAHYQSNNKFKEKNLISLTGGYGTFILEDGTLITENANAINVKNRIYVEVRGNGKIETSGDGAHAITTISYVTIKDNAQLSSTTGETIESKSDEAIVRVTGGTISATSENAIITRGKDAQILISGGYVYNDAHYDPVLGGLHVVYALDEEHGKNTLIHVSGNAIVEAKGMGGALASYGSVKVSGNAKVLSRGNEANAPATIDAEGGVELYDNAMIKARYNRAIISHYAIFFKGGVVFAYGSNISDIVNPVPLYRISVALAWNKDAGNTLYERFSTNDIFVYRIEHLEDNATAHWDFIGGKAGIAYANGTNTGFIPIEEVTIEGMGVKPITNYELRITVYPNPTTGELYIQSSKFKVQSVEVYDVYGRKCHVSRVTCHENIDISNLSNGIYFVKVHTEDGVVVKKVIKH